MTYFSKRSGSKAVAGATKSKTTANSFIAMIRLGRTKITAK